MKHRLFIGISLPDPVITQIIDLQHRLEGMGLPLMFDDPIKLHITVNFLGRVPEEKIPSVNKLLEKITGQNFTFGLVPSYLDCMYNKHADSYVYLGLSGDLEVLKQIQKTLSRSLTDLGIPQPERYFPHITVSRFKKADPVFIKSAMDKVDGLDFDPLPAFDVDRLMLYETFLSHKGSNHRQIGQFGLK